MSSQSEGNAAYLKRLRVEAAARGDCYMCRSRPVKERTRYCLTCLELVHTSQRAQRGRNPALGLCTECNRPQMDGMKLCDRHRERNRTEQNRRYHDAIKSGRCGRCKMTHESTNSICAECISRIRIYRSRRTA